MNTQKPSSFFIQTEHSSFLSFFCRSVSLAAFLSLLAIFAFTSFSSAQDSADGTKAADAMTIYQALNLKSAADLSLFSAAGTSISSTATVRGRILDQRTAGNSAAGQTDSDLRNAYALINELPCRQIAGTDLSDRTFKPGVYCLASTDLASRLTLDGQSDPKAIFVFRLADGLMVKNGARIDLANGAQAGSVFFFSNGETVIGDAVSFKGSVISNGNISVGANSEVDGRLLSLYPYSSSNVVIGAGSQVGPEQTGVLEICTSNDSTDSAGLVGRIFRFRVGSQIVPIVAGQCSDALTLPAGPVIITELQTGEDTGGAPFDGNF
ncbi:MAG: ice-binding family protein [Pyrinomonadaceae bacterium]